MKYEIRVKNKAARKVWSEVEKGDKVIVARRGDRFGLVTVKKFGLDALKRKDCLFTLAEIENEVVPNLSELKFSGEEDIRIKDLRIVPNPEAK